jgi:hypothetical protein
MSKFNLFLSLFLLSKLTFSLESNPRDSLIRSEKEEQLLDIIKQTNSDAAQLPERKANIIREKLEILRILEQEAQSPKASILSKISQISWLHFF